MSLLDELKKQAEAKQTRQESDTQRQTEREAYSRDEVMPKLVQIYSYLNELLKQVEILQADVAVDYNLDGYGPLTSLLQQGYELRTDSRDNMTKLLLGYYCIKQDEIKFEVETPQLVEQQKAYFKQHDLTFISRDYRDEYHDITHALFTFKPRIRVTFDFQLAADLATIVLTVRNYEGLGTNRYQLKPSKIDDAFLDELGKYILHRENELFKLELSENFRENLRQKLIDEKNKANAEINKNSM